MRSFSPFPHGTCSLSVSQWYLALPDGAGRFRQGFSGPALLRVPAHKNSVRVRGYHPLWQRFPNVFHLVVLVCCRPYNPPVHAPGFGLSRVRSPLLAGSLFVFLSSGYLDVSVPRVAVICMTMSLHDTRLPHSDIHGSTFVCNSPWLFAAYRVLRHP